MSNMSYCRWENTLNDLRDCATDLQYKHEWVSCPPEHRDADPGEDRQEPLSRTERAAFREIFELMANMLEEIGYDPEDGILSAGVAALAHIGDKGES